MSEAKAVAAATKDPVEARIEELERAEAKKEEAREKKKRLAHLEELELASKYEGECGGPRGQAFEILDLTRWDKGFVVLRRGEALLHKKFKTALGKTTGNTIPEGVLRDYVLPCVVEPSKDRFLAIVEDHPEVWTRCSNAMFTLHGALAKVEEGKF